MLLSLMLNMFSAVDVQEKRWTCASVESFASRKQQTHFRMKEVAIQLCSGLSQAYCHIHAQQHRLVHVHM